MVNRVMSVSERPARHRPAVRDSGEFPNSGFRHSELGSGRAISQRKFHRVLQWSNIWGLLHKAPWNLQMVC